MTEHSAPRTLRSLESLRDYFDGATESVRNMTDMIGAVGTLVGAFRALIRHVIIQKQRIDDLERKLNSMEKF